MSLDNKLREILEGCDEPLTNADWAIPDIKQAFADEGWRNYRGIKQGRISTGREWSDKFEKNLKELVSATHPTDLTLDDELDPLTYHDIVKVARKASGLQDSDQQPNEHEAVSASKSKDLSQLDELELRGEIISPDGDGAIGIVELDEPSKAAIKSLMLEERLDELSKVWGGMNTAAGVRDGGYSARNLNLDDLSYWIHNRRRVLRGEKALTPEGWLEAER